MNNALIQKKDLLTFWVFAAVVMASFSVAIWSEVYALAAFPLAIVLLAAIIKNYRSLYFLFFLLLPFSVEVYLPNGLGTDLPTEPIMLGLSLIAVILFLERFSIIPANYLKHPVTILVILHIIWMLITAINSQDIVISMKAFLAKCWYVIPFFFLSLHILRSGMDIKKLSWLMWLSLLISIAFVVYKHGGYGFTFKKINSAVGPFFRNHVSYAAVMAAFIPFVWALFQTEDRKNHRLFLGGSLVFLLIAIYFSYTRAAMGAVLIAVGAYHVIKWRLTKLVVSGTLILAIIGTSFLLINNKYLDYAPDFEKTVTHYRFDNLMEATYKMQDISTMERFYRWVAGYEMLQDRPIMGFGPGCFYSFYKNYSISSFQTYVSDNPDRSGIHNYFLMTFVEQGAIGFLLFFALTIFLVVRGGSVYHRLSDPVNKAFLMAALLSLIVIDTMLIINDLIETDKIGPLFFMNAAIIVVMDIRSASKSKEIE